MAALAPARRRIDPEWLDTLPALDPRALRSRRDLVLVNALMGNAAIVARELARAGAVRSVAEIGAGDGTFLAAVAAKRVLRGRCIAATLVDRQPCVDRDRLAALAARGWQATFVQGDVFAWLADGRQCYDAIVANLFLHHFEQPALARLLGLAAERTGVFIACEPRRGAMGAAGAALLGLLGCNDVTRHDAAVSVRAGFRDREIAPLWPPGTGWNLTERAGGPFSHLFVARRT